MAAKYFCMILILSWQILTCYIVGSVVTRKSNSVTILEEDAILIRHKRTIINGLSSAQQTEAVNKHNTLRAGEQAADMKFMKWNTGLADLAQQWADGCLWEHGQPNMTGSGVTYSSLGQNLFLTTGSLDVSASVQAWFDEKTDYDLNTGTCASGKVCGHYTQVVWAESWEVGCGVKLCSSLTEPGTSNSWSNAQYLVCNYGPPGNYVGQKPYQTGPVCSKCSSGIGRCNNNMCRTETDCNSGVSCTCAANCLNCGTLNTGSCSCTCHPGWHKTDCSAPCVNTHANCGANPGWPSSWCGNPSYTYVDAKCPVLCNQCSGQNTTICDKNSHRSRSCIVNLLRMK